MLDPHEDIAPPDAANFGPGFVTVATRAVVDSSICCHFLMVAPLLRRHESLINPREDFITPDAAISTGSGRIQCC